ncbi:ThuA domain-containing protein [Jiangella rhizosphaerae]|uniref:PKD domain-containing protein n=1 Tax=Jiangella rhizosphaerae TaxID=2293569 RepID=A0A418KT95_9ACTN|nr:ThuA domain-containing protein [Jiangella rhizosphaerae]RIQ29641.1 PKD domain-containing protein [Jiangella rhizosphaerae]
MRRLYRYSTVTAATAFLASLLTGTAIGSAHEAEDEYDVLFFHKTTGFRHDSIPAALAAVEELGADHGFTVTETQDAAVFTDDGLAGYEAIVFFTDGENTLDAGQRQAFERYIHRGGGFAGLHSTSNMDKTNWPWWSDLMGGAFFRNHPSGADQFQDATVRIEDATHPSTAGLPAEWVREDEWYNFTANPREKVHVLATLDESTYNPGSGAMGADHPIAWCANFDGGRTWYTALGHSSEHYDEPLMREHLLGGIEWAAGVAEGDCGEPREGIPTEASFEKIALDDNTANPMELAVAPDGRVFYVELGGTVKIYEPDTGAVKVAAQIPVHRGNENGLLGIALDPDFETNQWLYLFYSAPSPEVQHVSRFTVDGDELDLASESVLLEIPHQREVCCHSAGSMRFGPDGNLYISTGDDTAHFASQGYAPIDGRIYDGQVSEDAKRSYDARRTSGNTNDLRGKILRITPEDDGTYSIPEGNLFPPETSDPDLTRPEIYTMGHRNPFRIAIDDETGWVYAGEVGPDAGSDNPNRGPRGYDEWNQIREAGNYGWPYCIADNQAYREWDFATSTPGEFFDCENGPANDSPFNTGLDVVPPAKDAFIWYPYGVSPQFPELPTGGGRTAYAGDVYHYEEGLLGDGQFPEYYDGAVFVMEWSRKWIGALRLDENGDYESFEQFMPSTLFRSPHDMEFGPDGAMYLIEWGMDFNYAGGNVNPDSGLYKINYTKGARTPIAEAGADRDSGATPLEVTFSSEGSNDPDGDELTFAWDFGDGTTSDEPNPTHTYTEPGEYTVRLTVTDPSGRSGTSNLTITAGNTRPEVTIEFPAHGQVFDWGDEIPYRVTVDDAEDGSGAAIDCDRVTVQQGLYHDEGGNAHVHPGQPQTGCEGVIVTQHDAEHGDAADISLTVTASYTDDGGEPGSPALTGGVTHLLQQARKETEHFADSAGIEVDDAGDAETGGGEAIAGQDGAWASYEPYNLAGIGEMTLRVAAADDATVEVRRDAPDGELLGTAQIDGDVEIGRVPGPDGFGSAVQFNSGGATRYAELPTGVVSDLTGDFTIATWVNRAATGQEWSRIFDFGSGTGVNMFLTPNAGGAPGLRYAIKPSGASEQQITYNQELPAGWHHVAVTLSGTTGTLWLDGAPVATNTAMTFNPAELGETTQNWLIRSQYSADPYLNATLDEFHIFDSALTQAQLQALMAGPAGDAGGNVVAYDFDEAGGSAVADSSGQGNDATIVVADGAATWQSVTVDLAATVGTFPLHLVFPDGPVRVNWMELSAGVEVPAVSATVAPAEPDGQDGWYVSPVTVTLSADDPEADIEYRLGEGEWTAYTGPLTLDQDGTHTVAYRATNAAGTSEPGTVEVAVDLTAPETTATVEGQLDGDVYLGPATLTLAATDAASGAVETHYRLAGQGDHTVYSGPVTLDPAAVYEVEYRSVDAAGNAGDWQPLTVVVADTTVIVGGVDSGVANRTVSSGTTVNDLILDDQSWSSRGAFLRHVTEVTRQLQADGVITAREASSIQRAAAESDVGRTGGGFVLG